MKYRFRYNTASFLSSFFGGKRLRKKKLLAGIMMLTSAATIVSCGSGTTECYVQVQDSTSNNDTMIQSCYEPVAVPDTFESEKPVYEKEPLNTKTDETKKESADETLPEVMCYAVHNMPENEDSGNAQ